MEFTDHEKEAKKKGIGGGGMFKFESGENRFRILSKPAYNASHYAEGKPVNCTGDDSCPLCKSGAQISHKALCYIFDAKAGLTLANLPWSVYKGIGELATQTDWKFEGLPPYDIVINKTGEAKETRYGVMPTNGKEPISEGIMKELKKKRQQMRL